jgi:hypothetical protein
MPTAITKPSITFPSQVTQWFNVAIEFEYPLEATIPPVTAEQVAADIAAGFAADSAIPAAPTVYVFVPAGSGE